MTVLARWLIFCFFLFFLATRLFFFLTSGLTCFTVPEAGDESVTTAFPSVFERTRYQPSLHGSEGKEGGKPVLNMTHDKSATI